MGPRLLRRVTLVQAMLTAAGVTSTAVLSAGALVTRTDPEQFPDLGVGLWWAVTTVTTVGYGDVVPLSSAGRLVGATLMLTGVASVALLTAIAASAIVVGEVRPEERRIEREESEILGRLRDISYRLDRLERQLVPGAVRDSVPATDAADDAA